MSRESRILDDQPVVIRHVRRPQPDDPAGESVLIGTFVAAAGAELEALNGPAGWQSGSVESALSGDGTVALRLPNTAGDDGVLHRRRFALFTDPTYRVGEEWIEVYREPMRPESLVAVFTPATGRLDRGSLELKGPDVTALYTLARSSEYDLWHHAPRDVFDFYTRLPVAELDEAFPWTTLGGVGSELSRDLPPGIAGDAWSASARLRWVSPVPTTTILQLVVFEVRLAGGALLQAVYRPFDQVSYIQGTGVSIGAWGDATGRATRPLPGGVSLKILVRDRWAYLFAEGELVLTTQLTAAARYQSPDRVRLWTENTAVVELGRLDVESSRPFGLRGADKGELKLPGNPTPGGLRTRYYQSNDLFAIFGTGPSGTYADYLAAVMSPIREPVTDRLDRTINHTAAGSYPPNGGGAPGARATGAIYLDLSGNGRRLRITGGSQIGFRLWVGKTRLTTDALIDSWVAGVKTDVRTANLRDVLGEGSGWYPILLEWQTLNGVTFALEESALDASGNPTGGWTVVPASKLSPIGTYNELHRLESHRELLDAVADSSGLQWRVEPRTLESGEFPAQIIPRARVGIDTDRVLTGADTTDLEAEVDAMDAVDRLSVDAAGIADPKGSGQLSADVYNDVAIAAGHLFLSTGAESLPEITEPELLEQRASSLLALRASPNEQVGARPTSMPEEVTDTFPLTGALARRRWKVGDGLRLELDELGVKDLTPRQLTAIALPIFRQGTGAPIVGFRQRPRGLRAFLKRTARAGAAARRNWQGQLVVYYGNAAASPASGGLDLYSRIVMPRDLRDLVELYFVVEVPSTATTIEVNGVNTGLPIAAEGRYSLARYIQRSSNPNRMYARAIAANGMQYRLEAIVRL